VASARHRDPIPETQAYVDKVVGLVEIYERAYADELGIGS